MEGVRIFLNRAFARFERKERIGQARLCEAIARAERGLVDADLGSGIIKQRIARAGQGRSGGYRAIILVRFGDRAFYLRGFAKNEMDNITPNELLALKDAARELLALSSANLDTLLRSGAFTEIICNGEEVQE